MLGSLLQIAGFAASVVIGLIFLIAGIDKLRHRALLPGVIANYRLLPAAFVNPVALLLPLAELLLAVGLLIASRPATIAAMALLLVFAAAMAINIKRGRRHIDCGCGHTGLKQTLGWNLVTRNLLMTLALTPQLLGGAELASTDIAIGALAGLAAFLLMQMFTSINALPIRQLGRS